MPIFSVRGRIDAAGRFEISPEDLRHLTRVLRLKKGDRFEVLLPDGKKGDAVLEREGPRIFGRLLHATAAVPEKKLPLWLGIGLIRFSRLEWLVEKATEMGVERISPLLLAQGRFRKGDDISDNKIRRLDRISQESLKQCERNTSPRIDPLQGLESFCAALENEANPGLRRLILEERSQASTLQAGFEEGKRWAILVGPEGGFSSPEKDLAKHQGFFGVSLGPAILRSETAALYAASALDFFLASQESRP